MIIERDLSLKVQKGVFSAPSHYYLNEHVTILTNEDTVLKGKITSILSKGLMLDEEDIGIVMLLYIDIKDIANTDWLCGEDIRECN